MDVHGRIGYEKSHMSVTNSHGIEEVCSVWYVFPVVDFLFPAAYPLELAIVRIVVGRFGNVLYHLRNEHTPIHSDTNYLVGVVAKLLLC